MVRFLSAIAAMVSCVLIGAVSAQEAKPLRGTPSAERPKLESWYLAVGLGGAGTQYPEPLQSDLSVLESLPNADHTAVSIDLSVYFPTDTKTLVGITINGQGDRYEYLCATGTCWYQLNEYLLGASARRYFGAYIGRGLFVRADGGFSRIVEQYSDGSEAVSDWGLGLNAGAGYSFEIFRGTRFSIDGAYSYKRIEKDNYGAYTIGLGFMF